MLTIFPLEPVSWDSITVPTSNSLLLSTTNSPVCGSHLNTSPVAVPLVTPSSGLNWLLAKIELNCGNYFSGVTIAAELTLSNLPGQALTLLSRKSAIL